MKYLSNSSLFLSIVILIIGVSTTAQSENATHSNSYVMLKQVVGNDPRSTQEAAFAFLADLPPAELLQVAEQASVERDTVVLFGYTGREIIHSLRVGELGLRTLLDELERVQAKNDYYSYFLLWTLNSSPHAYSTDEQRSVFELSQQYINIDKSPLFQERLMAIVTANSMLEELVAQEGVEASVVDNYGVQLLTLATDASEDPEIRRAAIKGISEIKYRQAIPELLTIAQDKRTQSIPPVARSVCLTLACFGVTEAILPIQHILETTQDEYIFGSAAIALADIGGSEALRILVNNVGRMEGGYAGVAIQKLDTLILELLLTGDEDALSYVIRATEYLYKENQVSQYKSLLKEILFSTESKNLIRFILARLQQLVSHEEAGEIIDKIPFDAEYSDEWKWIERLSKAVPSESEPTNVPTDEMESKVGLRGIHNWEYGDAGYRENNIHVIPGMANRGHTGLMAGTNSGNSTRILEIGKNYLVIADGVQDNSWYDMINDPDFWSVNTLSNTSMTFTRRRDVVGTAVILAIYDIGYPWFPTPDLLRYHSSPGIKISPHEVSDLRCDGLVEYCYEYNGMSVWGKNSAHYDVSRTEWVSEHNNFYDWPWNSCEETAPDVQCGRSTNGGTCTYMTKSASGDLPTYSVSYSASCSLVDIDVTATDRSGIHYIKAKKSGGDYISSPVQPQHPNSASYTAQFSFSMSSSGWIYYYAKDNAGNYPNYAEGIYIELETTPPPPSYVSPSDGATNQTQPVYLDWGSVSGADKYQVQVDNNSNFSSPEKNIERSSSYYNVSGLADGTKYWWRVRAHNSCGWGDWNSGTWDFTTACPFPGTPALVSPPDGSVLCDLVYLEWSSVSGADKYQVQVDNNSDFSSPEIDTVISLSSSGLVCGTKYYWRVRAHNSCGWGNWSSIWDFIIECLPDSPPYVSPQDGATDQTQPVYLDWGDVDADKYQVQVDNNSNFSSPEKDAQPSSSYYNASGLADGTKYWWRVRAHNSCGWGDWNSGTWDFTPFDPNSVEEIDSPELPEHFVLSQNYPNPFNPETRIEFALPRASFVTIDVYNIVGRRIRNLANERLSAGWKVVTWDGRNDSGQLVSSGIYFYRIVTDDFTESKKMVLLK